MPKKKKIASEEKRRASIERNWDRLTKKARSKYFKQTRTKTEIVPMVKGKMKAT